MEKKEKMSRWVYRLKDNAIKIEVEKLASELRLTVAEVAILYNRGFKTKKEIEDFLSINLNTLRDPRLMKDADKASDKIIEYIKNKKLIVNYTDYDADGFGGGVTCTTLLKRAGANIEVFGNTRTQGFGMCIDGINDLIAKYPDVKLIITTDNGIVAFDAVSYANSKGIEVIITDHHEPSEDGTIPEAYAVVNPKQKDCGYPFKELCGAGVILKLLMLVYHKIGLNPNDCFDLIDVVAVATVADVVPLLDENRAIVKAGLQRINKEDKLIWKVMREVFSDGAFEPITEVNARTVAFTYGPAINACSRMLGSMTLPIELFMLEDNPANETKMRELAERMKDINAERKNITRDLVQGANALWADKDDFPVIVLAHEEFHEGIVGIIAGRLKEAYNRPCFVLSVDEADPNLLKGSARSIEGFPLKDVLDEIQNQTGILVKYGGHGMACGVTIEKKNLAIFELEMVMKAEEMLTEEDLVKKVYIDYALNENEFNFELLDAIKNLEPFGTGFEEPVLGLRSFKPIEPRIFGKTMQHVSLDGKNIEVVAWNAATYWDEIGHPSEVFVIGNPGINAYNKKIRFTLQSPDCLRGR